MPPRGTRSADVGPGVPAPLGGVDDIGSSEDRHEAAVLCGTSGASRGLATYLPSLVLGAGCLVLLALLVHAARWLTFWTDEWAFIISRPDPSITSLLSRHVDHPSLVPVLVYQALFRVAGLTWYYPYLAVTWALHFGCVWLLYAIIRRRAGPWAALVGGLSLLFLGSGWENLLHAFQTSFLLSKAGGLCALALVLDIDGAPRPFARRLLAAVALCIALASSGVGVLFLTLLACHAVLRRDVRDLLVAVPGASLFLVWMVIWGPTGRLDAGAWPSLSHAVSRMAAGIGAAAAGIAGLPPHRFALAGGLLLLVVAAVWRLRGGRVSSLGLAAGLCLLVQYGLEAVLRAEFPVDRAARSAYVYLGALLLWLVVADAVGASGIRASSTLVRSAMSLALMLAVAGNMAQFVGAARSMKVLRGTLVSELRLVEAARADGETALPDDLVVPGRYFLARRYLAATDRFGIPRLFCCEPPWTVEGYVDRARFDRAALTLANRLLREEPGASIEGAPPAVGLSGGPMDVSTRGACVRLVAGARGAAATWTLPGTRFAIKAEQLTGPLRIAAGVLEPPAAPLASAPHRVPPAQLPIVGRLPALPRGLHWSLRVELDEGDRVEVCTAAG
jgi:hypothetical protein